MAYETPAPGEPRRTLEHVLPGEAATVRAAHAALREERRGLRALWPFLGPAFIANTRPTNAAAVLVTVVVVVLNLYVLYESFLASR